MSFTPRNALASLITAIAVALTTLGANSLAYFLVAQMKTDVMVQVFLPYLVCYLVLLVLVFVGGLLGWLTSAWRALGVGLVGSIVAGFLGTYVSIASQDLSAATFAQVFGYLFSMSLFFIVAGTVATVAEAPVLMRRLLQVTGGISRQVALVRAPSPNLADGLVTHIKRKKVDLELANEQWDGYVEKLNACGWTTVEVEPSETLADSVFVEDTVVMLGKVAVITSPGATEREAEIVATEKAVRELGVKVERITKPGTLDGGDVLKIGSTIYVGSGGRTNGEGIRQFRAIASKLGYTVVAVPVTKALHLKTAVTALPDGTVIGYEPLVDNASLFPRFQPVPEAHGTAVVVLGPDLLLMSAAAPKTAALLESLGYQVITVDISEFEKLEGCVTCLSVRVR
jgi:dimethylargininase